MTTPTKAEAAAEQIKTIIDAFHLAGSENVRLRSEVFTLRAKVKTLEGILDAKESRLRHLIDYLDDLKGRNRPRLPEPELLKSVQPE